MLVSRHLVPSMRLKNLLMPGLLGALALGSPAWAAGPEQTLGVRHRIDAVVSLEPNSPLLQKHRGARGTLSFVVRLSANSTQMRFFGMVTPSFSDILVPEKDAILVAQTKIWEEDRCHQRRGLPKVTVTQVKASFGEGDSRIDISAVVRHIGLLVPYDELTPGIKLPAGVDEIGSFYALRAQTRDSRLNVDLKIYPFECFF